MCNTKNEKTSITLTNGSTEIEIALHGAEMISLKNHGKEYLWNGNPSYWKRHSPVLFPIVGSVWNGVYRYQGHEYALSQHGFARDMDFKLVSSSSQSASFELQSDEKTKEKYPFSFVLRITYELTSQGSVAVKWHVENPSDSATMYFSIGAHPAFLLRPDTFEPIDNTTPVGAYFRVAKQGKPLASVVRRLFGEKGCLSSDQEAIQLGNDGMIAIETDTFAGDAIVAEHSQIDEVTLLTAEQEPLIRLRFDAPLVGLWAPRAHEYSPFVCIEPWYGRADRVEFGGDFADKDWQNKLEPGQTFDSVYYIDVCK